MGLSIRVAERRLDAELFLDKYPRWEKEGPHQPVILHNMFLHAAKQEWKEPEADVPTIKLVGYQTSHKEIRDLYHGIYLLRRSPIPLPCGPQQREEAIWDILSSLRNCLLRQGYTTTSKEDTQGAAAESQSRPRRREDPHDEALREAHQQTLEAAHALEHDIERLSWGGRGCPIPPPPQSQQ